MPSRRDFIKLGSGALVLASLGSAEVYAATPEPVGRASVGFWPGVPRTVRRFRPSALPYLVSAESVLTGDPSFFSAGARAHVRGVWRPEAVRERAASFALDVFYEADGQRIPFHAWSFVQRPGHAFAFRSSKLAFSVPVDALRPLDLVLTAPDGQRTIQFSVNSAAGSLKLRPGYYFVALPEERNETIDWTRVRIREGAVPDEVDPDGPGVLTMAGLSGQDESVPFSYLILWVEIASQP
jgi:hypothetical protein